MRGIGDVAGGVDVRVAGTQPRIHRDAVVDGGPAASASSMAGVMPTPTRARSAGRCVPSVSRTDVSRAPSPRNSRTPTPNRNPTPCARCRSAEILVDAVDDDPAHANRAATEHAHRRGHALGAALRAEHRTDLVAALAQLGFEPRAQPDRVLLHNCPFHALATRHAGPVCGLNYAFLAGLVEGLQVTDIRAHLAPHPGRCCVELGA